MIYNKINTFERSQLIKIETISNLLLQAISTSTMNEIQLDISHQDTSTSKLMHDLQMIFTPKYTVDIDLNKVEFRRYENKRMNPTSVLPSFEFIWLITEILYDPFTAMEKYRHNEDAVYCLTKSYEIMFSLPTVLAQLRNNGSIESAKHESTGIEHVRESSDDVWTYGVKIGMGEPAP